MITNATATAAAASSFEPDFVFPLENVTVAQGRDGLYSNKSNEIFTCIASSDCHPPSYALTHCSSHGGPWNRIVQKSSIASTLLSQKKTAKSDGSQMEECVQHRMRALDHAA